MKTVAFFNNKGGVGKTSLVYHIAWMLSELGISTVAADLDPQANLTSVFLLPEAIEELWDNQSANTVYGAMRPLIEGVGDLRIPKPAKITSRLHLISGDLALSEIEDELSAQWPRCLQREARAFRVISGFNRIVRGVGRELRAEIGLIDVGPNLGAINRSALVAADYVIIPLSADLFAIRGLQNVGPKLRTWRDDWQERVAKAPEGLGFDLPTGQMKPIGYVVSRFSVFARGPVKAYQRWLDRAPETYRTAVENAELPAGVDIDSDDRRLARMKDYRSLMPMAQESRKPMFLLKPADGAIGGHQAAVKECYQDFRRLTETILQKIGDVEWRSRASR